MLPSTLDMEPSTLDKKIDSLLIRREHLKNGKSCYFYVINLHQRDSYCIPPFNMPETGNAKDFHPQNFRYQNQKRDVNIVECPRKKGNRIYIHVYEVYLLTNYQGT